jgi:hypothetical protein
LDDYRDFGVVDRKSVLSFIHHDAVIEAGSERLRQRLAQPRSHDAKHGFVSPREGGRFEIFFRRGGANGEQSFFAEWFEGVGQCLLLRVVEEEFLRRLFQGIARLHLIVARRPEEIGPRGSRFEVPEPWSEEVHRQNEAGRDRQAFLPADEQRSTLSAHFGDRGDFGAGERIRQPGRHMNLIAHLVFDTHHRI